ncbi:hypothetical protein UPYG_G00253670 [Umbra pygmaea]|uniref:ATP synthase membrane subunit f n=1 Tax=Umbra pygmaea TaxID=75934 RepID=A0ABD0WCU8_UMBPY
MPDEKSRPPQDGDVAKSVNSTGSLCAERRTYLISRHALRFRTAPHQAQIQWVTFLQGIKKKLKMSGRAFANWWGKMKPYYFGAYKDIWVGLGIMSIVYYKISYGGKKEVKGKAEH